MKTKSLLAFLSLVSLSTLFVSCMPINNQQYQVSELKTTQKEQLKAQWEQFLINEAIDNLLRFSFKNEVDKQDYITLQQNIDTSVYLEELRQWLYYNNNIQASLNNKDNLFSDGPYPVAKSKKIFDEFLEKNWLWFLFNLEYFNFIFFPEFDNFKATPEQHSFNVKDGNLSSGGFYNAANNFFIDHSAMIYSSNLSLPELDEWSEYFEEEIYFFLMNKDGFIFRLNITLKYDKDKNFLSNDVNLVPYIFSFDKLIKSINKKQDFNLTKYVQTFNSFYDKSFDPNQQILFSDHYGGEALRYTLVDVKKMK